MLNTIFFTASDSLAEPVHWAGYLCAGLFIRNAWFAIGTGVAWALLIGIGGWIIYPGESVGWSDVGPLVGAAVATVLVWWVRNLFRKARQSGAPPGPSADGADGDRE